MKNYFFCKKYKKLIILNVIFDFNITIGEKMSFIGEERQFLSRVQDFENFCANYNPSSPDAAKKLEICELNTIHYFKLLLERFGVYNCMKKETLDQISPIINHFNALKNGNQSFQCTGGNFWND